MLTASLIVALVLQSDLPKWQPPPGEESAQERALIDRAAKAMAAGTGVSSVLSDSYYDEVRPFPRFRDLIRLNAPSGEVTMVTPQEPGERLSLTFKLGKAGQTIYAYHTDARGAYGKNGVHIQANSGDDKYARLFAYVKTGPDGSATLHTIRPAGYPRGELPQHVHFRVAPVAAGGDEIWFSDDPRLTPVARERGRHSAIIVTPLKTSQGWTAAATIQLRER